MTTITKTERRNAYLARFSPRFRELREKARYKPVGPTMTDQSQARDTDINVIVKRYGNIGRVPAAAGTPIYEDWTRLPNDLRSMVEGARGMEAARARLPKELQDIPTEELLALTAEQVAAKLKPADKPADDKKDEQK